ncbi:Hypothetical protein PHPALM_1570 [Phytophthora palmivora]|uniref:CCHC-type domain-containing protein n=1 Tax=Phytophthora palmivora TaxID=4796 RepID=A0A2P4YRX0_9STRA|nr:Hypothetical protein PHPALM_1570 [Phytophthora palmivora]
MLEEVLRASERAKSRQKKAALGSSKYRQKATNPVPAATTKHVRAVQIRTVESESESGSDGSDGSDSDGDNHRRIYLAAEQDATTKAESGMEKVEQVPIIHKSTDQAPPDHRSRIQSGGSDRNRCSHCGSKKHSDLGCWRRLTRHKCGKRGHPADHCLFVCRGCGELYDMGKCPMEEFYNQIRQWFNPAKHAGRTRINITMAGSLVYFFDIWVGDLAGQDAILGMDFMIEIGQSVELQLHLRMSDHEKFWVTRGDRWVPTVVKGLGKRRYLQITNVSDKAIILQEDVRIGIWLSGDHIPRMPGFVSVGSRRYMEWQNLALEATVEGRSEHNEILMESTEPMVDRPSYPTPHILKRPEISQIQVKSVLMTEDQTSAGIDPQDQTLIQPEGTEVTNQKRDQVKTDDSDPVIGGSAEWDPLGQLSAPIQEASSEDRENSPDQEPDPEAHYLEDQEMSILPEINPTTDEVKIEDIQVGDPGIQTTAEIERLRQRIWKYRHQRGYQQISQTIKKSDFG